VLTLGRSTSFRDEISLPWVGVARGIGRACVLSPRCLVPSRIARQGLGEAEHRAAAALCPGRRRSITIARAAAARTHLLSPPSWVGDTCRRAGLTLQAGIDHLCRWATRGIGSWILRHRLVIPRDARALHRPEEAKPWHRARLAAERGRANGPDAVADRPYPRCGRLHSVEQSFTGGCLTRLRRRICRVMSKTTETVRCEILLTLCLLCDEGDCLTFCLDSSARLRV